MKSRVKWNSCKVKQEFYNFLYISSVNLTSVEYYNPNKYLWAFRFWATLLLNIFLCPLYLLLQIKSCLKWNTMKRKKTKLGYLLQKSGKLWSISCKNVIQHKVNTPYTICPTWKVAKFLYPEIGKASCKLLSAFLPFLRVQVYLS